LQRGGYFALGNFDGVHKGHQAVIGAAIAQARAANAPAGVLTFDPHPARFFKPDLPPFALTSLAQKTALARQMGAEHIETVAFDRALADLTAEVFVERYLVDRLGAAGVTCGYDFTFGKGRGGTTATLAALWR
jgi:riboflavin kinase / FMN adenylyltransferase